ncbi:hypothetical protein E6C27_scaffold14436G00020 [Cucumis melo var. makuwa]|uniref:Uncharacterized protein n=1 Tax=Cucumis melo var. makuwa TaxID=1194695 RepID=A0A5A7VEM8_CUCMM|nr:hypothetical protein E6C27_scaffold1268G00030 [Cucumis melo var. makuwa]KAA0063989.1 hypothetical protein E6C27_scaffold14436G00020 [Cucumis melo var. makuwa]
MDKRGRENTSSQCSSTRRYNVEVTHAILLGKARTTFNKRVPVPETNTGEPKTKALVNDSRHYNDPHGAVAKFLVGCKLLTPGQKDPIQLHSSLGLALGLSCTAHGAVKGEEGPLPGGPEPSASPKGNGGVQRFPQARWRLALECKGRRKLNYKTHPTGMKVGLSDLMVPSGRVIAQRIKVTLGIRG